VTSQFKITIEQYLEKLSKFAGSDYGRMVREQFEDIKGDSEPHQRRIGAIAAGGSDNDGRREDKGRRARRRADTKNRGRRGY